MAVHLAKLKKKKDEGATLTEMELAILKANSRPMEITTWPKYFRSMTSLFFKEEYLDKPDALKEFLLKNREYMYSEPNAQYSLKIDEDAKALGISNRDIKLLYKAVDFLQKGEQTVMAQRILERYTKEKFETAGEWKQWLDTNKNRLFFSDSGGYIWFVNTAKKENLAKY